MAQAMFTSMTGMNAGQDQLTVVSDNVANMNTTAYKTSRVDFQDIWYQTRTTGTNSTPNSGGKLVMFNVLLFQKILELQVQ